MVIMEFQGFCNPFEQTRLVWEPWTEVKRRIVAQWQRLDLFQIDARGRYMDAGLKRIRTEFWDDLIQAAAQLRQLLSQDAKNLSALAITPRDGSIVSNLKLVDEVSGKAAAPGKAAVGKAA